MLFLQLYLEKYNLIKEKEERGTGKKYLYCFIMINNNMPILLLRN